MSEQESSDLMTSVRTEHGHVVLMYPENICRTFGSHAMKLDPDGAIELLMVSTEGSGWVPIDDLPLVETGRTRSSVRRQ
jgi:hypothetical protein